MKTRSSILQGWPLVAVAVLVIALTCAALWLTTADAVAALRAIIRFTARSSLTLFLLAFTAAALWRFWPNSWTRWQRQNRRYLGVSFAGSHFIHLLAILTLRRLAPEELADLPAATWIFGGLAYAFIAAMTATSFDRTARALGPRAWNALHTTGSYYVWLIFANSYISRALMTPEYILPAALVIAALALRIAARIARARVQQPAVAG
jgi:DMSO/TMAO reductase YedYZ heme-binding membrane subunit